MHVDSPPFLARSGSRLPCALAIALLITGCTTEFFYNRLDTLASWYFEDLVSLSDDQSHELRDWLDHTLAWHRQSELQRYANFLKELSQAVATPGDRAVYDQLRMRFDGYVNDLVNKTAPDASRLLLELSAAQTDELLDNLARKAGERTAKRAKVVASNQWQREQRDDFSRQLKRWTGSISDQQTQIIAAGVHELEATYLEWAASQQAWREALRSALAEDHAADSTRQHVAALLREPASQWTESYAQKIARNRDRYLDMLAAIDASLSAAQRARLRDELLKLAGQLDKLAQGTE